MSSSARLSHKIGNITDVSTAARKSRYAGCPSVISLFYASAAANLRAGLLRLTAQRQHKRAGRMCVPRIRGASLTPASTHCSALSSASLRLLWACYGSTSIGEPAIGIARANLAST